MNQAPKVSVIVPVYKAENYLHKCVDSILAQTFTDFELLLIDDGSPDLSGEICDQYAAADSRVRVFHKPNGGVSSARNCGLDNACGEWVMFVDADDWIDEDSINKVLHITTNNNADICFFEFMIVSKSIEKSPFSFCSICGNKYFKIFAGKNECAIAIAQIEKSLAFGYTCNKLFKNSIIKQNNIRFDNRFSIQEDHLFTFSYIKNVSKIVVTTYALYYYVMNENSLIRKSYSYANTKERNILMYNNRIELCEIFGIIDKSYIKWFTTDYVTRILSNMRNLSTSGLDHKTIIKEIKTANEIIKNSDTYFSKKLFLYRSIMWLPNRLLFKAFSMI